MNGKAINIFQSREESDLSAKCQTGSSPLETYCKVTVGIKPYQVGKGVPPQTKADVDNRTFDCESKATPLHRLYLRGRDINRYIVAPLEQRFIKFGPWLAEPRPAANFDAKQKLVMRQTGDSLIATLDDKQYLCLNNMHVIAPLTDFPSIYYFLGLINSKLMNFIYQTINPEKGEALAEVKRSHVAGLPIRPVDEKIKADIAFHDRIVRSANSMLSLHKQLAAAKTPHEQTSLRAQIGATDAQIDAIVYQLYGLTAEEIALVEAATANGKE